MEHVVQLTYHGRRYTFRVERDPPLAFWRVEVEGCEPYHSPLRALGDQQLALFVALAEHVERVMG